jgi:hypothetical protein
MVKNASWEPLPGPMYFIRFNPSEYDVDIDANYLPLKSRLALLYREVHKALITPPPPNGLIVYICYSKMCPRIVPSGIIGGPDIRLVYK